MAWLPDGEKISKISIRFDTTHEHDRQTPHRPRLCIASRGKKLLENDASKPIFGLV